MPIASAIVQPAASKLEEVTEKLSSLEGVTVHTVTGTQIIIIIEADYLEKIESISKNIEQLEGVLGIYPTYVTVEDEEE